MKRLLPVCLLLGCANRVQLATDLLSAGELVERARVAHGDSCAPVPFATAEATLAFARARMAVGDGLGAARLADESRAAAEEAWRISALCGLEDRDGDQVADVVDSCPDEAEDRDGDRDEDGCPDMDPLGDLDGDTIANIDDRCPDVSEDFDGHDDEDGCPETSEDSDGDGVPDALDTCPDVAEDTDGFKDADGCPDPDNDLDLIPDVQDGCPDLPEDLDAWRDEDGCPDDDNDLDGIADSVDACPDSRGPESAKGCPTEDADGDGIGDDSDACPNVPETRNGYLDHDGCPDAAITGLRVTVDGIVPDQPIRFEADTARLDATSKATLDEIARVLAEQASRRLRIEGHVDGSLTEAAGQALSMRRAEAVYDHLASKGISSLQLEVVAFGATRPIDTNRTASGRERNARIELRWVH